MKGILFSCKILVNHGDNIRKIPAESKTDTQQNRTCIVSEA